MGPKIEIPSGSPFTIHNIPFGVFSTQSDNKPRCATAIGARVIDLAAYAKQGHFDYLNLTPEPARVFNQSSLNIFAAQQRSYRSAVRKSLIEKISQSEIPESCLVPLDTTIMHLPMHIGGYSDFYCSLEHVQNCSPMAVGASIPQNWFYAPSVYNGRASSVIPSPQPVRRPRGVYNNANEKPEYGPSQQMDFELEMGFFISKPIHHGTEMNIDAAEEHIFGFVLLNDWSSRDLQLFEMKPLGPFHGKGFGTSISPWIVTLDALQPFRCAPKTKQDPAPFPHLTWKNEKDATIDIKLRVSLIRDGKHIDLATSNLRYLYWTPFQQLAHHASAMCGMATGDLIGTGTISGDGTNENGEKTELGCLYEGTQGGSKDMVLPDQSRMRYLNDGDEVIMQAWCGDVSVSGITLGFGECRGVILPAFH